MEGCRSSTSVADPVVHLGVINISVIGYEWSYPIESLIYLPHLSYAFRSVQWETKALPLHGYPILQLAQFSMSKRTDITLIKKWTHRIAQLVTTSIATEHRNPWALVFCFSQSPPSLSVLSSIGGKDDSSWLAALPDERWLFLTSISLLPTTDWLGCSQNICYDPPGLSILIARGSTRHGT